MKNYVRLKGSGAQGAFSNKVTLDNDGFTDEPVVQCNVQVVENTFVNDFK